MIFEATVQYNTTNSKGKECVAKEKYVIENETLFRIVENIMYNKFRDYQGVDVTAIRRTHIKEVVNQRTLVDDRVFMATLIDTFTDDDGVEKETKYDILFYAKDIDSAHSYIKDYVKQGYGMSIVSIKLTKYKDIVVCP